MMVVTMVLKRVFQRCYSDVSAPVCDVITTPAARPIQADHTQFVLEGTLVEQPP
jgi:hypothetical protein